jgi:hypothetical protein
MLRLTQAVLAALLALGIGGIYLTIASQHPSPSVPKIASPQQAKPQETNRDTPTNERGTVGAPLVVKILPSADAEIKAKQDREDREDKAAAEWGLVILTGVLAVIGALQLFVFGWQGIQLKRTVDLGREEFLATHRPILQVRWVTVTAHALNTHNVDIQFGIINVGTSNATILGSSVNAGFLLPDMWPNPHEYPRNDLIEPRRFMPGATDQYVFPLNEDISLLNVYAEGNGEELRFYGYIVYEDDLKNTRTTYFCRKYDRDLNRFTPVDDPDYESID